MLQELLEYSSISYPQRQLSLVNFMPTTIEAQLIEFLQQEAWNFHCFNSS